MIAAQEPVASLLTQLGGPDAEASALAERALLGMGAGAVTALCETLVAEARLHRRRVRIAVACVASAYALCFAGLSLIDGNDWASVLILAAFCVLLGAVPCFWARPSRLQKRAAEALTKVDDVRAIRPLISAMGVSGVLPRKQVVSCLTPLLLRLRPTDGAQLGGTQREHFHYVLRHWRNFELGPAFGTEYIVAVLKALEQVGDARSLPLVEAVAEWQGEASRSGAGFRVAYNSFFDAMSGHQLRQLDERRIVEAARECLPYLRLRAEEGRASSTLLRASGTPAEAQDTLLRAAQGTRGEDGGELLRAGQNTE